MKNSDFDHYIITRYNLKLDLYNNTKNKESTRTDLWLHHRTNLFLKYCLPSFKSQKNQNFKWLVFFDKDSPDFLINIIKEIQQSYNNFIPFFHENFYIDDVLIDYIKNESKNKEYVITNNVDNDDILHTLFIEKIQQNFRPIHWSVIDLRIGMIFTIEPKVLFSIYCSKYTPFIGIVEKTELCKTTTFKKHNEWTNNDIVVLDDFKTPLWCQIVHDKNLVNTTLADFFTDDIDLIKQFGIDISEHTSYNKLKLLTFINNTIIDIKKAFRRSFIFNVLKYIYRGIFLKSMFYVLKCLVFLLLKFKLYSISSKLLNIFINLYPTDYWGYLYRSQVYEKNNFIDYAIYDIFRCYDLNQNIEVEDVLIRISKKNTILALKKLDSLYSKKTINDINLDKMKSRIT